jgi:hypothetical protein
VKGTKNGVRRKLTAVAAVSAALLIPLATFGGPALARSGAAALAEYGHGSGSAQYQYRVKICHVTHSKKKAAHTITVSSRAVRAHLRHGDHLGACTGSETRPAKPHKHHGDHAGDHGDQGKQGQHGQQGDEHGAAPQHGGGKDHKGK